MWHTCRANDREIDKMMSRARRKERSWAELMPDDPAQKIRVSGHAAKVWRDDEAYMGSEHGDTMVLWKDREDTKIDRFDGRALLDFISEPRTDHPAMSREEKETEKLCNFERYRDLVVFLAANMSTEQMLRAVEDKDERILRRLQAKHKSTPHP